MITVTQKNKAHKDIDKIFEKILPQYGLKKRNEQIRLSHNMLDAMFNSSIALSDAGTGIGKTYAYLVAGVVFTKYREAAGELRQPIVISTATIALQDAIHEEYIPFLSSVLTHAGYMDEPILSVVRKGKSRYVCDKRLKKRLKSIDADKKNEKNTQSLLLLKKHLDMDKVEHLSGYDRRQVAVPRTCDCGENCRYNKFIEDCSSDKYLFQICNHNLLIADAIRTHCNRHMILPGYCALVVDEAHKFPAAARQMFGRTLGYDEVLSLVNSLRAEHYPLAAYNLVTALKPVMKGLTAESDEDRRKFERQRPKHLAESLRVLESIRKVIGHELSHRTSLDMARMIATLQLFTEESSDIILYVDDDEHGRPTLCAAAADMSVQMEKTLWSLPLPILLTSGTLAVGEDFTRFKEESCLAGCDRITESVSVSPFNYEQNCLLYIPHYTPSIREGSLEEYFEDITMDISELLSVSNGHALILFNSYSAMSAVKDHLKEYHLPQPIFVLNRNNPHTLEAFRESENGILLATGAAWEGMDFPGDLVSMLIIPRLPFPIPDAFSDHEKEKYDSLRDFIHAVALPDMQIKLRQGFGRAIRLETDTCVVAVLDERAQRSKRYHHAVREALPEMHMTGSMEAVEQFFHTVKPEEFFYDSKGEKECYL